MSRTRLIPFLLAGASPLFAVPPPPSFLLPADVVPKKHIVELTIDPGKSFFEGWVRIEVELRHPSKIIWVNAKDIAPKEASVEANGRTYPARAEASGGEFIGLRLDAPAGPGPATLSIRYRGRLKESSLSGPYRKKIVDQWYAFTTFTPIEARRAFPCFDEPRFKTPWEMTIRVKRGHQAFANARAVREVQEPDGMKAVQFAPTEPLPAEVVAFAVGPFEVLDGPKAGQGTPVRVITAEGHAAEGRAAAEATVEVLPRLEAYTGIPYPFGKLDHLAVPEGAFGAVENPGLITYVARRFLLAAGDQTPAKTRAIRSLQAHEIAHQWFGDLVTQAGWEDVWLSEGFATWLSARVMDEEQPASRRHLSAIAARERIMATDTGRRARPVRLPMNNRNDLRGVYSQVVYQKGAAILMMLEGWLSENVVREGLRAYLRQHSFGNATTADLAAALRDAAGTDPTPILHSFLDQTGIPAVQGDVRCDSGEAPRLEIAHSNSSHEWAIPVCWRSDGFLAQSCTVLDTPHREIDLPKGTACPAWIYWNAGGTGYYRTEWTRAQLTGLANGGLGALTPAERLTLVYDLRELKKTGRADGSALLTNLAADTEPEIARAAEAALQAK